MGQPSVLLIEDQLDLLEVVEMLLESQGFGVTTARSQTLALELASHTVFDVILTDLLVDTSNVEDAWERIARLKEVAPLTPIGVFTGMRVHGSDAARREVAFVVQKPIGSEALLAEIAGVMPRDPIDDATVALIQNYFTCLERSDWTRLATLCCDDIHYHVAGNDPVFSRTVQGRAGFIELARETFSVFREPRFALQEPRPLPDAWVVRYEGSWLAQSGRTTMPGAIVMKVRDGLVAEVGVRLNLAALQGVIARTASSAR